MQTPTLPTQQWAAVRIVLLSIMVPLHVVVPKCAINGHEWGLASIPPIIFSESWPQSPACQFVHFSPLWMFSGLPHFQFEKSPFIRFLTSLRRIRLLCIILVRLRPERNWSQLLLNCKQKTKLLRTKVICAISSLTKNMTLHYLGPKLTPSFLLTDKHNNQLW